MTDSLIKLAGNIPGGIDCALITSDINRRYYLGFASSAGTLLIVKGKSYFIIDSRYFEAAAATVKDCEVILQDELYVQLLSLMKKHDVKTVGIETDSVSVSQFLQLQEKLEGVEILQDESISRLISNQRRIKSREEIKNISAAQAISDRTFSHILEFIKPGRTELEIAIEMESYARGEGSQGPAFSYIVAAGANSSRPHAVPTDNNVKRGDFIVLDFGATVNGYRSDMTRTVAVGAAGEKQREVYGIVLKAQLAGLKAIKTGAVCSDIDKTARDIIDATQYKGLFGHGLGHSLGLEVHEPPRFNKDYGDKLEAGMVMSVEPGIYIPGEFGVRIEDIVAVTGEGYENLVKSDKELMIINN